VNRSQLIKAVLLLLLIGLVLWLVRAPEVHRLVQAALERVQAAGSWAPVLFMVAYIVACVAFLPAVLLTLGAGILFGLFWGTLWVTLGATLGASCAFLISRYLARSWVEGRWAGHLKFRLLSRAVERDGWKVVLLLRLSPMFPFVALNYLFGLTRVPLSHFCFATLVGIIPAVGLFVYLGVLIGDLTQLTQQSSVAARHGWFVPAFGLVSALVVTILLGRLARRALRESLPTEAP